MSNDASPLLARRPGSVPASRHFVGRCCDGRDPSCPCRVISVDDDVYGGAVTGGELDLVAVQHVERRNFVVSPLEAAWGG